MRKLFLLKSLLLLCALIAGSSSVWAEEVVYKTALFGSSYDDANNNAYSGTWTATNNGFKVSLTNFNNNNKGWEYVKCGSKSAASVATITTSAQIDQAITKVNVTIDAITSSSVNSIKLYTSTNNTTWTEVDSYEKSTGVKSVSLSSPTENLYYKIEFDCKKGSANGLVQVSKVEYYYDDTPAGTVAKPTFSPASGSSLNYGETVTLTQNKATYIIYTTDNTTPTWDPMNGNEYSTPIAITNDMTIKAIAVDDSENVSEVAEASFTVTRPTAPTFSSAAGALTYGSTLSLSAAAGCSIIYTLNGTAPSQDDYLNEVEGVYLYEAPFTVKDALDIKAIAVDAHDFESSVVSASYTVATPDNVTLSPAGGSSTNKTSVQYGTKVTMTHPLSSLGNIRYTTNGRIPGNLTGDDMATMMKTYTEPITITEDCRIKPQFQTDNGLYWSDGAPDNYYVIATPDAPTSNVATGTEVVKNSTVTLSHPLLANSLGKIYYTEDGSEPTKASTEYTAPIAIDADKTIKARFITNGDHLGEIATFEYTYIREDAGLAYSETAFETSINSSFTKPTLTNPHGLMIAYESSDETIATVDAETGEVTINGVEGDVTIYARSAKDATYYAGEASYTIAVYDPDHKGTKWNPYNVAEALTETNKLSSNAYSTDYVYVRGIVSYANNVSSKKQTYFISEDGTRTNEFQLYQGKYLNNGDFTSSNQVATGDVVTVYGKLYNYSGTTPEMASGNYLYAINRRTAAGISYATSSYNTHPNATFTAQALTNPNGLTGITYASSNTDVAGVNAETGAVTIGAAEGSAVITATYPGPIDSNYKRGTASYTINVARTNRTFSYDKTDVTLEKGQTFTAPVFTDDDLLDNIVFTSTYKDVADVDDEGTITLGGSTGVAIIKATAEQTDEFNAREVSVTITVNPAGVEPEPTVGGSYVKVTSTAELTDGQYLIVYETGNVALNGNLASIDNNNNTVTVTWDGTSIKSSDNIEKAAFTYNATEKSFKSYRGLYLKGGSSKLYASETAEEHTISFDSDGNASLYNSESYLRFNANAGAMRFRYYSSSTNQQAIQLYKFVAGDPVDDIDIYVSEAGMATYASNFDLDFTEADNLEAYIATESEGNVVLTKTDVIPAGSGMLLRATDGGGKSYKVSTATATDEQKSAVSSNIFKRGTGAAVASEAGGKHNYILNVVNNELGFYAANNQTVATNRAYLQTSVAAARIGLVFDDESTGISATLMNSERVNGEVYNLSGQRVAQPSKGLYIVNGKKVVVK